MRFKAKQKLEIMDPSASYRSKFFGKLGWVCHVPEYSRASRSDKKSGLGGE
jgi:hypothetical protein